MNRTLASLLLLAAPVLAGERMMFRGPDGSGVFPATGTPVRWGPDENIRWKAELPGRGLSAPVVAGGKVFVTACTGAGQENLHVLCFDLKTGAKLWQRTVRSTGLTGCHPKTNMAAPTPVTDGKNVYALFATCDLVCFTAEGDLVWYRALERDYPSVSNQVGMAASPVLVNDLLIVAIENAGESFAAGIDIATGVNRWKVLRNRDISWTTPLVLEVGGKTQVVLQSRVDISGYGAADGKLLWRHAATLGSIPSPVASGETVLVPGGDLLALKPVEGKEAPTVAWTSAKLRPQTASPLVYQGKIFTVNSAGVLTCAEASDGNVLWQERLKGPFSASPAAADGKLYLTNEEGTTFVIDPASAKRLVDTCKLPDTILASPVAVDGTLLLRSDKYLYCIGAAR